MKRILRIKAVSDKVGLSRSAIYRRVGNGEFPKPFSLGKGYAVGWLESDIDGWIDSRVEAAKSANESVEA